MLKVWYKLDRNGVSANHVFLGRRALAAMSALGMLCMASRGMAICNGAVGTNFYVAPAGNDTNDCSAAHPCRQIRKALTLVQPGDTVFVADGAYLGFTASGISGASTNPITIKAQGTNAYVEATTDRADNRDNIFITYCQNLVLDGLNTTNAPRAGMRIDASPFITVRNGRFGNNATWGIFTDFSDDTRLENNECYGSKTQHGIYISNSSDRPVLRRNHCHDNAAVGIHMNGDLSQDGDGLITGALVENNLIHDNGTLGGAGINMDGVHDSIVRNNLLYNNHASGIAMFQIDGAQGPKGNLVAHNTIDQASNARWAILVWAAAGTNTIRNNILFQRNPARGGIVYQTTAAAGLTDSDYNAFGGQCYVSTDDGSSRISLTTWQAAGHEAHSFCSHITNLVVNALLDYHLKTNSPAIEAGQTLAGVTTDFDWQPRPAGLASDIGGYEFGAVLVPPDVTIAIAGSDVCLSFPTLAGKRYSVERTDDLTGGDWGSVTNNLPGTHETITIPDAGGAGPPRRFYRVTVLP